MALADFNKGGSRGLVYRPRGADQEYSKHHDPDFLA